MIDDAGEGRTAMPLHLASRLASWLLALVLLVIWQVAGDTIPGMTSFASSPVLVAPAPDSAGTSPTR